MSKKTIQSIVVILSILILMAFLAVIYGMYSKISISEKKISNIEVDFSINLKTDEKIKNIEVINSNKLLILIENKEDLIGLIYDINENKIINKINR